MSFLGIPPYIDFKGDTPAAVTGGDIDFIHTLKKSLGIQGVQLSFQDSFAKIVIGVSTCKTRSPTVVCTS